MRLGIHHKLWAMTVALPCDSGNAECIVYSEPMTVAIQDTNTTQHVSSQSAQGGRYVPA